MNFIASHPDLVRATYPELKETELLRAVERALESIFKFLLTAAFWRKWIRAAFSIGSGKARDRKNVREDDTPPALLFNQKPRLLGRFDSPAQTLIPLLSCREK